MQVAFVLEKVEMTPCFLVGVIRGIISYYSILVFDLKTTAFFKIQTNVQLLILNLKLDVFNKPWAFHPESRSKYVLHFRFP